jgi:hypothetical protein
MSGVTEALVWTKYEPAHYQAKGDAFSYVIDEVEGHFVASAFSPAGPVDMSVQVALAWEPTLDDAKLAVQLWEADGPLPTARAGRVRVYYRGYVEYHVTDAEKLMYAAGNEWAGGLPEDKKVGSLIDHTVDRFRLENLFAIDGAEAESFRVSASLQPAAEGPTSI